MLDRAVLVVKWSVNVPSTPMIRVQILQPFSSLGIVLRKDDNKFKEEAEAWSSFERFEKANE